MAGQIKASTITPPLPKQTGNLEAINATLARMGLGRLPNAIGSKTAWDANLRADHQKSYLPERGKAYLALMKAISTDDKQAAQRAIADMQTLNGRFNVVVLPEVLITDTPPMAPAPLVSEPQPMCVALPTPSALAVAKPAAQGAAKTIDVQIKHFVPAYWAYRGAEKALPIAKRVVDNNVEGWKQIGRGIVAADKAVLDAENKAFRGMLSVGGDAVSFGKRVWNGKLSLSY